MKYICKDGIYHDISEIRDLDNFVVSLKIAYYNAISADSFYSMTNRKVIETAGVLRGNNQLPFIIQNDLTNNLRIRDGEISGEISRMFVD
ncbi:MAG: hypothetical protein AABX19_04675 [Nanoarchaeota archaeon]